MLTKFALPSLSITLLLNNPAYAIDLSNVQPSVGDFGSVGLLQTPTARMAQEGTITASISHTSPYTRATISAQPFPWMEASIHYTDVSTRLFGAFEGNQQTYKDKSIDAKFRINEESYWLPEVSVGVKDIGGTGLFDSEYLVASKRFGALDTTVGIAWGYHGTGGNIDNPLTAFSEEFAERPSGFSGNGGIPDTQRFFRGPASVFGGVEYHVDEQLSLKAEYDANDYKNDFGNIDNAIKRDSAFNFGLAYRWNKHLSGQVGWERGNTATLSIGYETRYNDTVDIPLPTLPPAQQTKSVNVAKLGQALAEQAKWENTTLSLDADQATLMGRNQLTDNFSQSAALAGAVTLNHLPAGVNRITVQEQSHRGLPLREVTLDAPAIRAAQNHKQTRADWEQSVQANIVDPSPINTNTTTAALAAPSPLEFSHGLSFQHSLGSAETFVLYSLDYQGEASWSLAPGVALEAQGRLRLTDNYDFAGTGQPGDGAALPPVRTLVRKYSAQSAWADKLDLSWQTRLQPQWYAQAYAGYLETMYAGAGAEVLYRPLQGNWAAGADINYVQQRDPNAHFGLLDYQVATGHASLYYNPRPDVLVKASAGQYLAGDKGVTLDFSKQFKSGTRIGVFASFTNVSAEDFGEGSFYKGFYMQFPLSAVLNEPTRDRYTLHWIPLQRDGGQKLHHRELFAQTQGRAVN